jgi:hypothetical protein
VSVTLVELPLPSSSNTLCLLSATQMVVYNIGSMLRAAINRRIYTDLKGVLGDGWTANSTAIVPALG